MAFARPLPEIALTLTLSGLRQKVGRARGLSVQEIKKSGDTYSRAFGTSNRLRKLNNRVRDGNGKEGRSGETGVFDSAKPPEVFYFSIFPNRDQLEAG